MKPVTGDGAPWYTSGTHMWNGTAETLKTKPTRISAMANRNGGYFTSPWLTTSRTMPLKLRVPRSPYRIDIP